MANNELQKIWTGESYLCTIPLEIFFMYLIHMHIYELIIKSCYAFLVI